METPENTTQELLLGPLLLDFAPFVKMHNACVAAARAELSGDSSSRAEAITRFLDDPWAGLRAFRDVRNLADDALRPLVDALLHDVRLPAAQRFVAEAFGISAEAAARRLSEVAAARGEDALRVYTRARPAGLAASDILHAVHAYTVWVDVPLGGVPRRLRVAFGGHRPTPGPTDDVSFSLSALAPGEEPDEAAWLTMNGKASAEHLRVVLQRLLDADAGGIRGRLNHAYVDAVAKAYQRRAREVDEAGLHAASLYLRQWVLDHNLGVDAAGFAFHATAGQDVAVLHSWRQHAEASVADLLMHHIQTDHLPQRTESIPILAARPGDLLINAELTQVARGGRRALSTGGGHRARARPSVCVAVEGVRGTQHGWGGATGEYPLVFVAGGAPVRGGARRGATAQDSSPPPKTLQPSPAGAVRTPMCPNP